MTQMTPWLQRHLIAEGHMTQDRVTTRPTTRACPHCSAPVLAAIEDERPGTPRSRVELTPTLLTPYGELQALLAGLPTFEYDRTIWWRGPERITNHPANIVKVLAQHKCQSPAFDHRTPSSNRTIPAITDPTVIPF